MTREEKKQRLARLAELNKRSLGVSSFGDDVKSPAMVAGMKRAQLAELRERVCYFYRNGNQDARQAWTRKYRNL